MSFSASLSRTLALEAVDVQARLERVLFDLAQAATSPIDQRSQEHLSQGAGRRIGVLAHCLSTIFEKFPPSAEKPLPRKVLYDVQVAHHAFVINLYGYFENLAWAFILRHNLENEVGGRKNIGLFLRKTQSLLPYQIRNYLTSQTMIEWHEKYLKNYRDALAHRVPLYIPPSSLTNDEVKTLEMLASHEQAAASSQQWNQLEEILDKKANLGRPCLFFAHSFSDNEDPRPIYLHPQLLCDAKTVIDFTPQYLAAWHERE